MLSWFKKRDGAGKPGGSSGEAERFEDPMPDWKPPEPSEEAAGGNVRPLEISCEEAARVLEESTNKRINLVDVREKWEHDARRLEGSTHVPLGTIPQRLDELADLATQSDLLLVYCEHGMRSLNAVELMRREGIDQARSLEGGMAEWASAINRRIEKGPPAGSEQA